SLRDEILRARARLDRHEAEDTPLALLVAGDHPFALELGGSHDRFPIRPFRSDQRLGIREIVDGNVCGIFSVVAEIAVWYRRRRSDCGVSTRRSRENNGNLGLRSAGAPRP